MMNLLYRRWPLIPVMALACCTLQISVLVAQDGSVNPDAVPPELTGGPYTVVWCVTCDGHPPHCDTGPAKGTCSAAEREAEKQAYSQCVNLSLHCLNKGNLNIVMGPCNEAPALNTADATLYEYKWNICVKNRLRATLIKQTRGSEDCDPDTCMNNVLNSIAGWGVWGPGDMRFDRQYKKPIPNDAALKASDSCMPGCRCDSCVPCLPCAPVRNCKP